MLCVVGMVICLALFRLIFYWSVYVGRVTRGCVWMGDVLLSFWASYGVGGYFFRVEMLSLKCVDEGDFTFAFSWGCDYFVGVGCVLRVGWGAVVEGCGTLVLVGLLAWFFEFCVYVGVPFVDVGGESVFLVFGVWGVFYFCRVGFAVVDCNCYFAGGTVFFGNFF